MQINIIPIGNSKGVRLPKAVLEQCGITDKVELSVESGKLILTPLKPHPRAGWEEGFRKAAAEGLTDEEREWLDTPLEDEWNDSEWAGDEGGKAV